MAKEKKFLGRGKGSTHKKARRLVFGVGINDVDFSTGHGIDRLHSYILWKSILRRCYGKPSRKSCSYEGCSVCKEWEQFSVFKEWYDRYYVEGYHIDKDILVKGSKVYSPETCNFVPPEINTLIVKHDATRGDLPIGVSRLSNNTHRYRAIVRIYKKYVTVGNYNTPEEAFNAYKEAKERHIQEMSTKYFNEGKITEKVYNALMNYRVEITD